MIIGINFICCVYCRIQHLQLQMEWRPQTTRLKVCTVLLYCIHGILPGENFCQITICSHWRELYHIYPALIIA